MVRIPKCLGLPTRVAGFPSLIRKKLTASRRKVRTLRTVAIGCACIAEVGHVLHFLCFYGHPTLSTWFTTEYKKSGKKLDMGKGCVRFKSLEDLALDVVGRTGCGKEAERPTHQIEIFLPTAQIRHLSGDGVTLAAASKDPWRYSGLPAAPRITVNWVAPA
jgi:hypothetical protein